MPIFVEINKSIGTYIFISLLFFTTEQSPAADNTIIVRETCRIEPGRILIETEGGDICACDESGTVTGDEWEQVGTMEGGLPMCAKVGNGTDEPEPPDADTPDEQPPTPPSGEPKPSVGDYRVCGIVRPLEVNSGVCEIYPIDYVYAGAAAKCFCKCAGDSEWSKYVRACLACAYTRGASSGDAHKFCYENAQLLRFRMPTHSLWTCVVVCSRQKDYPYLDRLPEIKR